MSQKSLVVPTVPVGGNTKTPTVNPAKRWCFTLNNYTEEEYETINHICSKICTYHIIGKEVGEQGTPHLQGYLEFKTKARPKSKFKFTNKIHWEKAKGTRESNELYCKKGGNYRIMDEFANPFKLLLDLYKWQEYIDKIVDKEPDDRSIYWFWDADGNKGKTTFAKWLFMNKERVVVLSGKGADMKNGIVEYQKKNKKLPRTVIINVPRSTLDYVSYTGLEEVKDMFFFSGKYEGGMVCGANPHVIIFANEEPHYEKMSGDRWKVYNIDDMDGIEYLV